MVELKGPNVTIRGVLMGAKWILLMILIMVIVVSIENISNTSQYDVQEYTNYLNQQVSEDGVYSFDIDLSDSDSRDDLLIRSSQQTITVKIDGEIIYDYDVSDTQFMSDMPPSKWHIIDLTPTQETQIITIEYYTSYSGYKDYVPALFYGPGDELVTFVTLMTFPACFMAWVTILLGVFTVFICYVYKYEEIKHIHYLGVFLIMFGIWSLGEAKSLLFNYTDLFIQSQITMIITMLIPIPVMQYIRINVKGRKNTQLIDAYCVTCIVNTIIGIVFALTGVVDMIEYIIVPQILLVVGVGIVAYFIFQAKHEGKDLEEKGYLTKVAIVILGLALVLDFRNMYLAQIFLFGIYLRVGVLVFIMLIYVAEILKVREDREKSKLYKDRMQSELYKANVHLMTDKMTPHFMHNTLLAIQELCYSAPEEAADAIGIFSRYIRINLEGIGDSQLVPFEKELEYLKLYMNIQQICYEDDINFEMDVQVRDFYIPPFSIQPIIENAVVHGIRQCRRQGFIKLKTWYEEEHVVVSVEDNGAGFVVDDNKKSTFSSSIAVVYRIEKVLHGTLDIKSELGRGTIVTVRFPKQVKKGVYSESELDFIEEEAQ